MLRRRQAAILAAVAVAAILGVVAAPARAQTNDPSFRIVNNTSNVVEQVYASPSNQRSWGQDRLGSEVIPPGQSYIVRLPADGNCAYDVRIVYQGGQAEERRGVNLCTLTDYVLGGGGGGSAPRQAQQGGNPSFNLVNRSGRVIEQFYASPASEQSWGQDRLGDDLVNPGQRYAIRLPMGECLYDIRIVFQGGEAQERRRVDACNITDYVVR
jgi:hypothetical protein